MGLSQKNKKIAYQVFTEKQIKKCDEYKFIKDQAKHYILYNQFQQECILQLQLKFCANQLQRLLIQSSNQVNYNKLLQYKKSSMSTEGKHKSLQLQNSIELLKQSNQKEKSKQKSSSNEAENEKKKINQSANVLSKISKERKIQIQKLEIELDNQRQTFNETQKELQITQGKLIKEEEKNQKLELRMQENQQLAQKNLRQMEKNLRQQMRRIENHFKIRQKNLRQQMRRRQIKLQQENKFLKKIIGCMIGTTILGAAIVWKFKK